MKKIFALVLLLSTIGLVFTRFGSSIATHEGSYGETIHVSKGSYYGISDAAYKLPPGSRITSSPAGIDCPTICSANFESGTKVTLTMSAGEGYGITVVDNNCAEYTINKGFSDFESRYRGPKCTYTVTDRGTGHLTTPTYSEHNSDYVPVLLAPIYVQDTYTTALIIEGDGIIRAGYASTSRDCQKPGCTIVVPFDKLLTLKPISPAGVKFNGWHDDSINYECSKSGKGTCYSAKSTINDGNTIPAIARFTTSPHSTETPLSNNTPVENTQNSPSNPNSQVLKSGESEIRVNNNPVSGLMEVIGNSFIISGNYKPNSEIQLVLYSDPIQAEVLSDADGNWEYEFTNVPTGEHHLELVEKGSDNVPVTIAKINVLDGADESSIGTDEVSATDSSTQNQTIVIISIIGVVFGLFIYLLIKYKMHPVQYLRHLFKHR